MANLTIVAHIHAKEDLVELVSSELQKLIAPTRAEAGCVQYDLHQDDENPAHFMFLENWETKELWQAHMNSQHLKQFQSSVEGLIESLTIHEMTQVS